MQVVLVWEKKMKTHVEVGASAFSTQAAEPRLTDRSGGLVRRLRFGRLLRPETIEQRRRLRLCKRHAAERNAAERHQLRLRLL